MKAYQLLDSPERWTQKTFARDSDGAAVDECSLEAVCWCMAGAVIRCYPNTEDRNAVWSRLQLLLESKGLISAPTFNDTPGRTFEEVRAVLKEAGV